MVEAVNSSIRKRQSGCVRWRPVLKQVLPWRSLNSAAGIDPQETSATKFRCNAAQGRVQRSTVMNSMVVSTSPAGQTLMSRLSSNVKFSSEKTPPLRNRTAVGQALACDIVMGTSPAPAPRREWAEVESLKTISWNRSPRGFHLDRRPDCDRRPCREV